MRRFVSVDLETTGVDPHRDFIVEVGLAGEDYITKNYFECSFSLDFPEDRMSEGAAAVNGWGRRVFGPKVPYDWAAAYITSQLTDVHVIGKNPAFDTEFLKVFLSENGLPFEPWHHRLVDIGCLAWGSWQRDTMFGTDESKPQYPLPPKTDDVERMLGIPRETIAGTEGHYHSALLDARWNYEVFRQIVPLQQEV